jgi:hypothetical protein
MLSVACPRRLRAAGSQPAMTTATHDRCRFCGRELPAWLPVAQRPWEPMLLHHLSLMHLTEVGPYLARMRTEDIATVAAEAFDVIKSEEDGI